MRQLSCERTVSRAAFTLRDKNPGSLPTDTGASRSNGLGQEKMKKSSTSVGLRSRAMEMRANNDKW
ncbi:uncharacterized protein ColSpa_08106 [Colletotrichum spaethianum]|uniref:Uncharacterized protein n=1 Tax=Colletotrichum spaethianum TaxID=700344 RepID=A0AA37UN66_9PEZI|nr:uncharacterized protein ColSpa_08106 [Colletotrichum spaethianum]GKT47925.1 hypothetical protein ColSpa_08106 [Colletotrichum spaethianum]